MKLEKLPYSFTVCKVDNIDNLNLNNEFCFVERTDEEISVVCKSSDVAINTTEREDGWKAFRIKGVLDFSLIGILSKISSILA